MASTTVRAPEAAASDVLVEKRKLKKSLIRWDLLFFTVTALVGIDTLGQATSFGTQTLFWLVFLSVFFLIPYGLITAELGTRFPVEGAVYEWVRLAYGHLAGAVTAVMYWVSNPIWLGGTLAVTAIAAMDALWGTSIGGNTALAIIVGLAFIWIAITMNILSLRQMKWVPNLGAIVRVVLIAVFGLLVVGDLVSGKQQGSIALGDLSPTVAVFVGVLGVLIFNYVGFELQTNASEEMDNPQRDVPRSVGLSGIVATLAYMVPVAGVLLALNSKSLSNVSGFVTGYQTVVSSVLTGGSANLLNGIVGLAVIFSLMAGGVVWLMGADRCMAIGALAGSGPRALGYFSKRFGTPIVVNVLSGVIATVFLIANFAITGGNLRAFFAVVLGLVISTTTFSYLLIFPAIITLRRRYGAGGRGYRIPGGMAVVTICALVCEFFVVAATVFSLWPGVISGNGIFSSDATSKVFGLDRGPYELTVLVTMGVIVLIGVGFWMVGRRRQVSAEYELITASGESLLES
ncbi:MAG TPA: APC family permease [Candidatus Limnocylindrales bacterium]|nr:APC family permease [Candidatus Limnocylindrales bacterium]